METLGGLGLALGARVWGSINHQSRISSPHGHPTCPLALWKLLVDYCQHTVSWRKNKTNKKDQKSGQSESLWLAWTWPCAEQSTWQDGAGVSVSLGTPWDHRGAQLQMGTLRSPCVHPRAVGPGRIEGPPHSKAGWLSAPCPACVYSPAL